MESFDEDLSLAIFGDISLGNTRLACADCLALSPEFLAWELPFQIVRFESFDWNFHLGYSLGDFRLIALAWDPSFGNVRFGTFTLELSFWNFSLGTFAGKLGIELNYFSFITLA